MPDIDDPFKPPPDATIMRPRPGAGRRGTDAPPSRSSASAPPPTRSEPIPDAARDLLGSGLNPLVQAASPLLLLAGQLRGTLSGPDVPGLRRHVLEEIRRFEERARHSGISNEIVLAARYALCAGLDEAVLSTPWGAQSEWAQQTLLVALHREAWGGEKFFEMLDRISQDPVRHIDLMELQYLCIALGFAGKYQVRDRGHSRLAEVQQDLYRRIREQRGTPRPELSLKWEGIQDRRNPLIRYIPWWVVGAAALAILTVTFVWYYRSLAGLAEPVEAALATIGTGPVASAAVPDRRLKVLLGPEEAGGSVSVAEEGGLTKITLESPTLFASGSAVLDPAYEAALGRVAGALNQVPGRVLVVGHTDDQPLRSFRFGNNVELSRARAASVVEKLKNLLENPARLEATGVGSSQPRSPASEPGYRARNRRVELIHGS